MAPREKVKKRVVEKRAAARARSFGDWSGREVGSIWRFSAGVRVLTALDDLAVFGRVGSLGRKTRR